MPAPKRFGLGLGAGEVPLGVSDSERSSQSWDLARSDPGEFEESIDSFLNLLLPVDTRSIFRLAADNIPDMMSLAEAEIFFAYVHRVFSVDLVCKEELNLMLVKLVKMRWV